VCSFDSMDHDWTLRFLQHRVGDKRLLRLIRKWLKVGVAEDGKRVEQEIGAPQGAVISPILANIYLHYVYDLWINQWRKHNATGDIIVIRYADDTILGFQYKRDADSLLKLLESRLAGFSLSLHPAKTRLLQFGRYAQERHVRWLWYRALCRRSQRRRMNWTRFNKICERFFPPVRIMHPQPLHRFDAKTRERSPVR
jgi:RNA-directed DNA polymerase